RFGFDLLYPVQRYIDALTQPYVADRNEQLVPNPIFAPRGTSGWRHPSRVLFAAAVGVPWQDISDEASWSGEGLRFLSPAELTEQGRWDVMLGDPENYVLPSDPLMVESVDPRSGSHPLLGVPVAPPTSTDPQENPINGHEQNVAKRDDLQYACIFPLATPRSCTTGTGACDCNVDDLDRNRPLCQPPGGGDAGTTQYWAKAYPGIRELEVLKGAGDQAIVASVCPKIVAGDIVAPFYGYNPVATDIVDRAAPILRGP
ncbi:MAG TPA: hypothetical protein VGP93_13310, partial [Polyangiaceae bacterium]|nr:hypothetical protein [Polyangiaceae bacterium]